MFPFKKKKSGLNLSALKKQVQEEERQSRTGLAASSSSTSQSDTSSVARVPSPKPLKKASGSWTAVTTEAAGSSRPTPTTSATAVCKGSSRPTATTSTTAVSQSSTRPTPSASATSTHTAQPTPSSSATATYPGQYQQYSQQYGGQYPQEQYQQQAQQGYQQQQTQGYQDYQSQSYPHQYYAQAYPQAYPQQAYYQHQYQQSYPQAYSQQYPQQTAQQSYQQPYQQPGPQQYQQQYPQKPPALQNIQPYPQQSGSGQNIQPYPQQSGSESSQTESQQSQKSKKKGKKRKSKEPVYTTGHYLERLETPKYTVEEITAPGYHPPKGWRVQWPRFEGQQPRLERSIKTGANLVPIKKPKTDPNIKERFYIHPDTGGLVGTLQAHPEWTEYIPTSERPVPEPKRFYEYTNTEFRKPPPSAGMTEAMAEEYRQYFHYYLQPKIYVQLVEFSTAHPEVPLWSVGQYQHWAAPGETQLNMTKVKWIKSSDELEGACHNIESIKLRILGKDNPEPKPFNPFVQPIRTSGAYTPARDRRRSDLAADTYNALRGPSYLRKQ